jgi:hypothetical protein
MTGFGYIVEEEQRLRQEPTARMIGSEYEQNSKLGEAI